jgi:hypothetical protein
MSELVSFVELIGKFPEQNEKVLSPWSQLFQKYKNRLYKLKHLSKLSTSLEREVYIHIIQTVGDTLCNISSMIDRFIANQVDITSIRESIIPLVDKISKDRNFPYFTLALLLDSILFDDTGSFRKDCYGKTFLNVLPFNGICNNCYITYEPVFINYPHKRIVTSHTTIYQYTPGIFKHILQDNLDKLQLIYNVFRKTRVGVLLWYDLPI